MPRRAEETMKKGHISAFCDSLTILNTLFNRTYITYMKSESSWDCEVGTAICYRLDSPGLKPWWKQDFPDPSSPALRTTQPPAQWILGLSPRGKAARTLSTHPFPTLGLNTERTIPPPLLCTHLVCNRTVLLFSFTHDQRLLPLAHLD